MPFTGIDALEAATHILGALYAWRTTLAERRSDIEGIGSPQLTIGLIKGGINTNVVPDRITFRLDRRMVPEEFSEAVEAELVQVIGEAAQGVPGGQGDGAPDPARPAARAASRRPAPD